MAAFLASILVAYLVLYFKVVSTPELFHDEILPYLPWWCLVSFGAYALGTLGWDVLTFKDKPEKYRELMGQIKEAKADLKQKGLQI